MFAGLGAQVAIAARRMDVLSATAAEIQTKTGGVCEAFRMDVKDPVLVTKTLDDIVREIRETADHFGEQRCRQLHHGYRTVISKCNQDSGGHRSSWHNECHQRSLSSCHEGQAGLYCPQHHHTLRK
ncbi:hypothetical protein COOONC_23682, partial [Cooperia oncophora]